NQRFDTEQAKDKQEYGIRAAGETRAEHGDTRAAAEESRKQKGFETTQGETDPKALTSTNARASNEARYPKARGKSPQHGRARCADWRGGASRARGAERRPHSRAQPGPHGRPARGAAEGNRRRRPRLVRPPRIDRHLRWRQVERWSQRQGENLQREAELPR